MKTLSAQAWDPKWDEDGDMIGPLRWEKKWILVNLLAVHTATPRTEQGLGDYLAVQFGGGTVLLDMTLDEFRTHLEAALNA